MVGHSRCVRAPAFPLGAGVKLTCARRDVDGKWLLVYHDEPVRRWSRGFGFAFVVSQV